MENFLLINSLRNIDSMETELVTQPESKSEQSTCAITTKSILWNKKFSEENLFRLGKVIDP